MNFQSSKGASMMLVIDRKSVKRRGCTVLNTILFRADEVIR